MSYLWKENMIDIPIKNSQSQPVFWPWVCFLVFFFCFLNFLYGKKFILSVLVSLVSSPRSLVAFEYSG